MANLGKAKSLSVSLPELVWPLIDEASGKQGRSAWLGDLVESELKELGLWPNESESGDQYVEREAKAAGVDVSALMVVATRMQIRGEDPVEVLAGRELSNA